LNSREKGGTTSWLSYGNVLRTEEVLGKGKISDRPYGGRGRGTIVFHRGGGKGG